MFLAIAAACHFNFLHHNAAIIIIVGVVGGGVLAADSILYHVEKRTNSIFSTTYAIINYHFKHDVYNHN